MRKKMEPRFDIDVKLIGQDGNAFNLMGIVSREMKRAKDPEGEKMCTQDDVNQFIKEATESDYDHLLSTCMKWVNVS